MSISSLEQKLSEQHTRGNLNTGTIAAALQEARKNGEYLYNIRSYQLKGDIYKILINGHTDTTTMLYID
ncbi:hypothetical protein KBA84_06120 [Patescibacteria group bacterium]|jgi:hypothetical protein|nr:hypothetical protein [Patescibacteria group bacterium]